MFNDIYYPAFSVPAIHPDNCRNTQPCSRPARTIDKEMYKQLLKSFEDNDTEEGQEDSRNS